jgi:pimeloyl-ACP methyl ester carboxylesterase
MRIAKFVLSTMAVIIIGLVCFVYVAPKTATGFIINADRHRSGLLRKEIDLPGGLHYVYLEGGKGEPLMLLHGFGANKDHFTKVARFLTPHYRVIVPDHIGFGESSHPQEADYAPAAQAERLRSFAYALGIQHLHLGGSSMGGQIAMTYAARHPAEVASLWLIDPAGVWSGPKSEFLKTLAETGRNQLLAKNVDEFRQVIKFAMYKQAFIPRPITDVLAQERITNYALEERIFKQIEADSVEKRVFGMPIPTLIVWGDKDRVLNFAAAQILHKLMPRSQVIIMPDVGHLPMMERPKQSAEDYLRFRTSL